MEKWTCPFACFLFFLLFSICFLFVFLFLFCFYPGKKPKKKRKKKQIEKAKKKNNKNAKGQVHFFPIFSPFLTFFVFPFILLPVFFGFEVLFFDVPCVFLFFCFFFKFKKTLKLAGEENITIAIAMFLPEGIPFKKNGKDSQSSQVQISTEKNCEVSPQVVDIRSLLEILGNLGITSRTAERNKLPRGSGGEVELWMFRFPCIYSEYWENLVGGWATPLKNISQMGLLFPIYGKKNMFQTTNQKPILTP